LKKSPNDKKIYSPFTLKNGLKVLLIQNDETEKSAAALAVNVGHFNDPHNRQGLAHFLEHMLFLGTKKYPDGSEYQQFISQYGGSNNAWTATEHTCFFFDIHHYHFTEALDRFSQFFTAPLLSKDFVMSERQNIDAEFKLKLKDDIRRLYDVHKETINQAHPFSQFSVGTIDTLNDRENSCIRDEVAEFFKRYYCADYMTLAIEGPQPIDELKKLVEEKFTAIKHSTQPHPIITAPLYLPEHLAIKIAIKPVKEDRKLIISFAMPSIDHLYRQKPEAILSYLLGHEGKGSILSLLKEKQWAMALTAGAGINGSNFKDFNISIALTQLGEQHLDEIINIVFSYINLLKQAPLPEHYYLENQAIAEVSFLYHDKMSPLDSVSQLAINMQHYPTEDYIFGDYIMESWNQTSITKLLGYLSSDNMRIIHVTQGDTKLLNNTSNNDYFNKTSFWYQVPYRIEKITKSKLAHWQKTSVDSELFLPAPNAYIAKSPQVFATESNNLKPKLIEDINGFKAWYKQDISFNVPKGHIYLNIDSPIAISNCANIAMTRLFADLYTDAVTEENYDAELAGIHYHVYAHQGGITVQLSGISINQEKLLINLLTKLKNNNYSEQRFELFKQQLITHWQNSSKSKSISQLFSKLSSAMQPHNPGSNMLAEALTKVSFTQFKQFSQDFFQHITLEVLIHGNWLFQHAKSITQHIKQAFDHHYNDQYTVKCPIVDISAQGNIVMPLRLSEHDHACVVYFPFSDRELKTIAKSMLLSQLLSPLFFQQMRTEKQYGYLVGVGYIPINRYPGIAFYIQSPHIEALTLMTAINEFIEQAAVIIETMTADEWQHLQQGLASQLQEQDTNLRIRSQRFWAAICNKDDDFSHKDRLIKEIINLTFAEVKALLASHLLAQTNPDRITLMSLKNLDELDNINDTSIKIKSVTDFAHIKLHD
jgi:secreted Zn-dependent insulinase-like peptidase